MDTNKTITEDEFDELYQPIQGESGHLRFEVYWAEPELGFLKKVDERHLWTQVEFGDEIYLVPGWCRARAVSVIMSMLPWTEEDRDAGLRVVCEDAYDEKTYEDEDDDDGRH